MNYDPPKLGMIVTVYGVKCRIFKVHPMGTIDVVSIDGRRAWRITGLPFFTKGGK
jgi:hypothetical protein